MTRTAQDTKIRRIVLTGLFSALIFVFTAYIHVPTGAGYTHAGDGFIYLAACLLPAPYAVAAGMIGGALADGLTGFPVWIPHSQFMLCPPREPIPIPLSRRHWAR